MTDRREPRLATPERAILAVLGVLVAVTLATSLLGNGSRQERRETGVVERVPVDVVMARDERLRGLRFRHPLHPRTLSRAAAQRLQLAEGRRDYPARRRRIDEEELKLVALLGPRDDLRKLTEDIAGEEVLGFYDDRRKRLVVVRQGKDPNPALEEFTLSHELIHALEDQRFGLRRIAGSRRATDDESSARDALVEGTATLVMSRYAERHISPGRLLVASLGAVGGGAELPPALEDALLFPYEQGERFVRELYRRGHGWGLVNRAERSRPPASTEQVLHVGKYLAGERPLRVRVKGAARVLGPGWRRLDSTAVGEFDLRTILKRLGASPVAEEAAAGWGGGRLDLWRRGPLPAPGCRAPCIARDAAVMRIAWDSAADRRLFDAEVPRWILRALHGEEVGAAPGVGLWRSRGGAVALRGAGRVTTVAFAPDPRLAVRLASLAG